MKKTLFVVSLLILSIVVLLTGLIYTLAADLTYNDFSYYIKDGSVVISRYNGSAKEVTVPASIDTLLVTEIGKDAFAYDTNVEKVILPEGLKTISLFAFKYCSSLSDINIPDSVTEILDDAFMGCSALDTVGLPEGLTKLGNNVFNGTAITDITLPAGLMSIGYDLLKGTPFFGNADNWENGCLYVNNYFIAASTDVSGTYYIKEDTKLIAASAFAYCTNVEKVVFPANAKEVPANMFWGCKNLKQAVLGGQVVSVGGSAFSGCASLTKIDLPLSVTSIGTGAFSGCSSLTDIKIPAGVTKIERYTFMDCKKMTKIEFSKNVTLIEDGAFHGTGLTTVNYRGTEADWSNMVIKNTMPAMYNNYSIMNAQRNYITSNNGDLNGDTVINSDDAIHLLYYVLFGAQDYPISDGCNCDYDNNGEIEADDAIYLLYHVLFGEEEYPI